MIVLPGVKYVDIRIDVNSAMEGAKEVLRHVKPEWPVENIVFKVDVMF